MHPKTFNDRAEQSRQLGAKLVRFRKNEGDENIRHFLDELPADKLGRPMKQLQSFDCGIFCEEKGFNDNHKVNEIERDKAS